MLHNDSGFARRSFGFFDFLADWRRDHCVLYVEEESEELELREEQQDSPMVGTSWPMCAFQASKARIGVKSLTQTPLPELWI